MNWNELTLGRKLGTILGAIALSAAVLIYFSLSGSSTLGGSVQTLAACGQKLELLIELKSEMANLRTAQRGVIMYAAAKSTDKVEQNKAGFQSSLSKIRELMARVRPLLVTQQSIQDLEAIGPALDQYAAQFAVIVGQCQHDDTAGALATAGQAFMFANEMQARAESIVSTQKKLSAAAAAQAADTQSSVLVTAITVSILVVVILAVSGFVVRNLSGVLKNVAGELNNGAAQVASAAGQVSSSSQSLAQGASEQAASLQETSASTEEINSMARKNTENSRTAADYMGEASKRIAEANTNLEQMVSSMREINTSSDKISKIIKVIDEIAFQTNILALNAAVEAARAGEAGMGFAVVADEVRNLAQRCAQAARDTSGLIEDSIEKSNQGRVKLDEVAAAIRGVTESSGKVKTLVDEVNVGSQEQARGIEQIARAIAQMEQVTQKTAAGAEEGASAGEELTAQSETLRALINQLVGMVQTAAPQQRAAQLPAKARPATLRPAISAWKQAVPRKPREAAAPTAAAEFPLDDDFTQF